jgi:flagellar L-ring protein precursor FlgH
LSATRRIVLVVLALALLGGCARLQQIGQEPRLTPPGQPMPGVLPPPPEVLSLGVTPPEPRPVASLWQPTSLFNDRRARRAGDILTVVIEIADRATINNRIERSRGAAEGLDVGTIFGIEQEIDDILPGQLSLQAGVDLSSDASTRGQGSVARDETIELKLAAMVTEVLPNGNLVILGSQEIRVNYELRDLQVAGIIRPEDIARDNTIFYDQIAEARVVYGGRGQVYQYQQPRYGQQVLDIVLPF